MRYKEFVRGLKTRMTLICLMFIAAGIISGLAALIVCLHTNASTAVLIAGISIPVLLVLTGLWRLTFMEHDLSSMWRKIDIYSDRDINALFENCIPLSENESDYFISDEYILNFESFNAYRLSDIRRLKRSASESRKGNAAYYIDIKFGKSSATKKDTMSFNTSIERDMVFGRLSDAIK